MCQKKRTSMCVCVQRSKPASKKKSHLEHYSVYMCIVVHSLKDGIVVKLREMHVLLIFLSP